MKWQLIDFKTSKEEWFDAAEALYIKKIKPFVQFEVKHLKTIKAERDNLELKKKYEEKAILAELSNDDFVILLDENGKKISTINFVELIKQVGQSGKKRCIFIIGGAFGVTESVKKRATKTICLSDFTMNHLVAETVLLEQIYRVQTILNRIPYHNN